MGGPLRPSAIEKASLNEPTRKKMQAGIQCHINILEFVCKMGIEAFNLTKSFCSTLLPFLTSTFPSLHPGRGRKKKVKIYLF
jgi:hypothetical protein